MRVLVVALGLWLALAVPGSALTARTASFDCARAATAIERIICDDPRLSAGDRMLAEDYRSALSRVSAKGRNSLRDGQRQWLAMVKTVCTPTKPDDLADAKTCLTSEYEDRIKRLHDAVRRIGGLTFRRVDIYRLVKDGDPGDDSGSHHGLATTDLSYPVIDAPNTAAERAFDRYMQGVADRQQRESDDSTDQYLSFDDISVTPRLISVETVSAFYGHGTPHGQYASQVIHWMLSAGRLLTASDVFAGSTGWQAVLRDRCYAAVAKFGFVKNKDALNDMVIEPDRWSFGRDGLTVAFRIYEVASYADGEPAVLIPWPALRAYLRPDAPVPAR